MAFSDTSRNHTFFLMNPKTTNLKSEQVDE